MKAIKTDMSTDARERNEQDPRNYLSQLVSVCTLREKGVADDPRCLWNFDAFVMQTPSEQDRAVRERCMVPKATAKAGQVPKSPKVRRKNGKERVGIKILASGNALATFCRWPR